MNNISQRYFGLFANGLSALEEEFSPQWGQPLDLGITDEDVLLADYSYGNYEGSAFVLYEKDGQLYEVHGGHCSCYGLEGQWEPEETSWTALAARVKNDRWSWYGSAGGEARLRELLEAHA